MGGAVNDFQLNRGLGFLVSTGEFEGLVDRHLRILIAM